MDFVVTFEQRRLRSFEQATEARAGVEDEERALVVAQEARRLAPVARHPAHRPEQSHVHAALLGRHEP